MNTIEKKIAAYIAEITKKRKNKKHHTAQC